jgi:hypothetical protein
MIETIMTVFAIGVFVTFGTVMVIAALLYFWTNK